ncbi:TlpA family protein disulfide reductase [Pedobacter sandarakinus]|uniref:TlpA family protein disulfide reductase n=1 Tax=Pedobacter sandarakinus TaxID=353156 RepID=UPI0022459061|nr:TlpA disulfide reductase family protein [Pedobacter sandarakinus]MCX2575617.1 TlpA disulfide reductase family protein [Pedobacter sandarakinus]
MKKILFLCVALCAVITGFAQKNDPTTLTKLGDQSPDFSFEIEKGKTVNLSQFKGKLILINLFATWCPPCNTELPLVQTQIWDKYKENNNFAFFVFGREEGWDKLIPYKTKKGFTFPILPDLNREVFGKFATQSIPRNVLIDETGKIIYQSIGYEPAEFKSMVALIDQKLKSIAQTK